MVEMSNPLCNLPLLRQIADASGGTLIPPASLENALDHVKVTQDPEDTVLSSQPLWDHWSLLWVFIGCLTIEWLARKRLGMV